METLHLLSKELSNCGPEGSTALIQGKMANLSNTFNTFKDTVKEKWVLCFFSSTIIFFLPYKQYKDENTAIRTVFCYVRINNQD